MARTGRPRGLTAAIDARRQERRDQNARRDRRLRGIVAKHAPRLVAGEKDSGLDARTLATVLTEAEAAGGLDSIRSTRRRLREILFDLQKASGGRVELPAPEVSLHRPPSPFRPQKIRHLPWLSEVTSTFLADLVSNEAVSDEVAAGRVLFAAIVFGGLLNQTLIARFPTALHAGVAEHDGVCWVDIHLDGKDEESTERVRRWFPDPVSQSLIARWRRDGSQWPEGKPGKLANLIRGLFDHLRISHGPAIRSPVSALLGAAQTRLRLHLPGVLVDFLASDDHGQSVSSRSWWRLVADRHLTLPEIQVSEQEAADEICATAEPPESAPTKHIDDSSRDLESVIALKKSLKSGGRFLGTTSALRAVVALRATLGPRGPMFTALLDWAEWLLQKLSSGTRRSKPQSVYRYLASFAHPLVALAGELNPTSLAAADLGAKYQEVLSSIRSTKERGLAAKWMRDFHSFLVLTRDVVPVEIDGIVSGKQQIRANAISDLDYTRTLGLIDRSGFEERTRRMLRVMLIVAYRLGPRRNELAYLRLSDVHDGSAEGSVSRRPLLWIHTHPDAALKTDDSIRRLPLAHLLTPDELRELLTWKQDRLLECGPSRGAQALLFCFEGRNTERLPDATIDILVKMVRHVCLDDTIVLHTFRHSFLSHLFVRLLLAELSMEEMTSVSCPWLIETVGPKELVRKLFSTSFLPREAAYLLCTVAGHLDPTETMHTYVHFQDWIAGLFVRERTSELPVALWAALEGIGSDTLMVRHSREKKRTGKVVRPYIDTPRRLLRHLNLAPPAGKAADSVPAPMPVEPDARSRLERLPLEGVYCVLALQGRPMSHLARQHVTGIDRKISERLRKATLQLAGTVTSTRNRAARRPRFLADRTSKRRRPALSQLPQLDGLAPAIPRERSEREDAREAFRCALKVDNTVGEDALSRLLQSTSHSDPVIICTAIDDVDLTTTLLHQLGIPRSRIRLEIRSLPKSATDAEQWKRDVAKNTGIAPAAITLAGESVPITRSASTHPAGLIAVQVLQPVRASKSATPADTTKTKVSPRLAYGWRVGCYYALCVKRSLQ